MDDRIELRVVGGDGRDGPRAQPVEPGEGYDGVVRIGQLGSGVLLESGRHVLTAAHVVEGRRAVTVHFDLEDGRQQIRSSEITLHPGWNGRDPFDLAIVTLSRAAPTDGYGLFTGDPIGREFELVGYGATGNGRVGDRNPNNAFQKYAATNVYDGYGADAPARFDIGRGPAEGILLYDFDGPSAGTDASGRFLGVPGGRTAREGNSAPGDSGGPTFIDGQVAGIVSGGFSAPTDIDNFINSTYGEFSYDMNVAHFAGWIARVAGLDDGPTPTPTPTPTPPAPEPEPVRPEPPVEGERLVGSRGADRLIGADGGDTLIGRGGRDTLSGRDEADVLRGGGGRDALFGGGGDDVLRGGGGQDTLRGQAGSDVLDGRGGHDDLYGGGGDDVLVDGRGFDLLTGGPGADRFVFEVGRGNGAIEDFGRGNDVIDLTALDLEQWDVFIDRFAGETIVSAGRLTIYVTGPDAQSLGMDDLIL